MDALVLQLLDLAAPQRANNGACVWHIVRLSDDPAAALKSCTIIYKCSP